MPTLDKTSNRTGGCTCKTLFVDEAARALLADKLAQLRRPQESDGWQKVKENSSRTVYRNRIDGSDIFLKHFHRRSLFYRMVRSCGISDAKREFNFMQYLSSHGVETAPVLAAMCGRGVEWVATRAVAPAQPADAWHERQLTEGLQGRLRIRRATIELAKMIGRMHSAGVIHRDLHAGNLLVRMENGSLRLVLMDMHRAARKRKLSRKAKAANVAQLYHDRFSLITRTERVRFLKHYLRASGAGGTLRGWQLMVEHFAQLHTRRLYAKRDRRIVGTNRYFAKLKLPHGWRGHVVLASKRSIAGSRAAAMKFSPEHWRQLLASPEALFMGPDTEVIKDSRSSLIVRRKLTIGQNTVDVFIKRARRKRARRIIQDCFRRARAIRAFRLGHALITRKTATALPLAALERRAGPFLVDDILITEAVNAGHLNQFLSTWLSKPPTGDAHLSAVQQRQLAQEVLWQLGRLVQRLHDNDFAHRDLKASNMLVHWSEAGAPEIVLIDLDGVSRVRRLSARRRFQGLMRLNVSLLQCRVVNHAGRLRMLLGYLRRPGSGRINFKPYWRVLERWSARKLRQQIRSRRRRQEATRRPAP